MKKLYAAFLFLFAFLAFSVPASAAEGDEFWWDGFALPDLDGWVHCAVEYQGSIVIGGLFSQVGGIAAQNIARWDGSAWTPLGAGFDHDVMALTVHEGQLVAGGWFVRSGTQVVNGVARWNGQEWSALGSGFTGGSLGPYALASSGGVLYAAGQFEHAGAVQTRGVARWNGVEWSALGSGLQNAPYPAVGRALCAVGESLYVGGSFDSAGGVPASQIALWDGDSWSSLGSGLEYLQDIADPRVTSLLAHDGRIYVGGEFQIAGGIRTNNVAAWDGQSWHAVGDTTLYGVPSSVAALAWEGDHLLAAGFSLYAWDGVNWAVRTPHPTGSISSLLPTSRGMLVGGRFLGYEGSGRLGAVSVGFLHEQAWIDPMEWNARMRGLGGFGPPYVTALASHEGSVVAAGDIRYAGTSTGRATLGLIARWDGERWSTLGAPPYGSTTTLLSANARLYAAGFFSAWPLPGTSPVMMYSGGTWSPLDTLSLEGATLAFHEGQLFLGARGFTYPGARGGVYRWNDARWEHLADVNQGYAGITALRSFGGRLVAAGAFDSIAGLPASGLASWDGTTWSPMNGITRARVDALAECGGELYAAGQFQDESFRIGDIAKWDGVRWSLVTHDKSSWGRINTLACVEGQLFAGGFLRDPVANEERGVMRWNGAGWSTLGSGVNGPVTAMTGHRGDLFVGGRFSMAGGKSSSGIARWSLRDELRETAALAAPSGVPNPFRATTAFAYRLADPGHVRVTVHDLRGRRVAVLQEGGRPAGTSFVIWDGRAEDGRDAPAGIYFVRMELPGRTETRRVVRLK